MHKHVLGIALGLAAATAFAASGDKPGDAKKAGDSRIAQQSRMKTCSSEAKAKALKGDERKAFMGECLRKKA